MQRKDESMSLIHTKNIKNKETARRRRRQRSLTTAARQEMFEKSWHFCLVASPLHTPIKWKSASALVPTKQQHLLKLEAKPRNEGEKKLRGTSFLSNKLLFESCFRQFGSPACFSNPFHSVMLRSAVHIIRMDCIRCTSTCIRVHCMSCRVAQQRRTQEVQSSLRPFVSFADVCARSGRARRVRNI